MSRISPICVILAALSLALSACESTDSLSPMPSRRYVFIRNGVDASKPCLIAKLAEVPVRVIHGTALVPVVVNGVGTVGVLDTGAEMTIMTPAMAAAAKITIDPKQHLRHAEGIAGVFDAPAAMAKTLQIGHLMLNPPPVLDVFNFVNSRNTTIGIQVGGNSIDGLDWDLDFQHGLMTSYRTRNCHDIDPLWDTKSTGLPLRRGMNPAFATVAGILGLPMNVTVPVQFDGGIVNAVFDTGSMYSMLSLRAAHWLGITNKALARDPEQDIAAIDQTKIRAHRHIIPNVFIGESPERDFMVYVPETANKGDQLEMILGMDWIATHRLWLSYTTDSLYIDSGEKKPASWKPAPKLPS